jgi:hypothetical protein
MSHFTRLKTQLIDRELLRSALTDLGHRVEVGDVEVRGWNGRTTKAELKVATRNKGYDIGFVRSGKSFDLVADWYGIRGVDKDKLVAEISRQYAYRAARTSLEQQGFQLVQEEKNEAGEVHLVLRRG